MRCAAHGKRAQRLQNACQGGGKAAGGSEGASRSVPLRWDGRSRAASYRIIGSQSEEKETEAKRDRGPERAKSETGEAKIKRKERKKGIIRGERRRETSDGVVVSRGFYFFLGSGPGVSGKLLFLGQ